MEMLGASQHCPEQTCLHSQGMETLEASFALHAAALTSESQHTSSSAARAQRAGTGGRSSNFTPASQEFQH